MKKILVTGGFGKIGKYFVSNFANIYQIRVADINVEKNFFLEKVEVVKADIRDYKSCINMCNGVDTIIHLAGVVDIDTVASFEEVLDTNIIGTRNIFKAAIECNCKKIIFASSAQTVENYPKDIQVKETMLVRPKSFYGISKSFAESLAGYHTFNDGIAAIGLRIGAYEFPEDHKMIWNARDLSAFTHPDDLNQLLQLCIENEELQFEIFNAISDNRFKRLDITEAKEKVGYKPQYDGFEIWNVIENNTILRESNEL